MYFLSSGERKGRSPNLAPLSLDNLLSRGSAAGGCKVLASLIYKREELQNVSLTESAGKQNPRG